MKNKGIDETDFLQKTFVEGIAKLQESGFYLFSFILMAQGIETLGAFLDDKPLKAKAQSKKRFNKGLKKLFPARYAQLNESDWLYEQLRCNVVHLFVPGFSIQLLSRIEVDKSMNHLSEHDDKVIIIAEDFYEDFKKACEKVIAMFGEQKLKSKKRS